MSIIPGVIASSRPQDTPLAGTTHGVIIVDSATVPLSQSQKIDVAAAMGVGYIRPAHQALSATSVNVGFYNLCKSRGFKMIQNLNWNQTATPSNLFAANETTYKNSLNQALADFAGDTSVVKCIVIENEPTNDNYYGDTMEHYLRQLAWAIQTVRAYDPNIKITDGCTHVPSILSVKQNGSPTDVAQIIQGIADLANGTYLGSGGIFNGQVLKLDYVNMHFNNNNASDADVVAAAQYLRTRTGIQDIMSNEHSIHTDVGSVGANMVQWARDAGLVYAVPFGGGYPWNGSSGTAAPFNGQNNVATALTPLGFAVRDAILGI